MAHDPITPIPPLTREPLASTPLRTAQPSSAPPAPATMDLPDGATPAPLSAAQVLQLLAGEASANDHSATGVLLNLSLAARAQDTTALSASKAQAVAELLAFLQNQSLALSILLDPVSAGGGEALWKAFLRKAGELGLLDDDPASVLPKNLQGGTTPSAPPALTPSFQQKVDSLLLTLRATAESLVGKAASLWAPGPLPQDTRPELSVLPPSSEGSQGKAPLPPTDAPPLNQPFLQALWADIDRLGLKIPEPLLESALQHGVLPTSGSELALISSTAQSPEPETILPLALRVLGGLQQLESVRQVIDSNLFKTDYFKSSAGLISSLLNDIAPRPNLLLGGVPGIIPAGALPVGDPGEPATASTPRPIPTGAMTSLTESLPPGGASSGLNERIQAVLQFLAELGSMPGAPGREALTLLGGKIQQIQQALAESQGPASQGSAAFPPGATPDPSRLADPLIREALARGFIFDLELRDQKNPETMARLAGRLAEAGVQVNRLGQSQGAGSLWRVMVPGQDPRPTAPPVALDPTIQLDAHPVAEPKAKAAMGQARGGAGGNLAEIAPGTVPRPSAEVFSPLFPREALGLVREADPGVTDQSQGRVRLENYSHPEAFRMSTPFAQHPAQGSAFLRIMDFFKMNRDDVMEGKIQEAVEKANALPLLLEYSPIEVLRPAKDKSADPRPIHFGNPGEAEAVALG